MALPYPGMDFTPLDILTAAEMDKIVANIESLANGTGIADGVIQARKVDFKTFGSKFYTNENAIKTYKDNRYVLAASDKFEFAGRYIILASATLSGRGSSTDIRLKVQVNDKEIFYSDTYWHLNDGTWGIFTFEQGVVDVNKGDSLTFEVSAGADNQYEPKKCKMSVIRIG